MPDRPYKGLMPYDESDARFFFGREAEVEIISANIMASRFTLLYGPSGAGKSSVIRAGVVSHLRTLSEQNVLELGKPDFAVVVFDEWRDDPIAALGAKVEKEALSLLSEQEIVNTEKENGSLVDTLRFWSEEIDGDLLIILDQFEEYFLYHPGEDGDGTLAVELPRAVNRQNLRVSFLISIREDALAKLDLFKGRIPSLFDNYLRIDHLDRSAAQAAIEKPIAEYNRLQKGKNEASIETELVKTILNQLAVGKVMFGADRTRVVESSEGSSIETPYLQLVISRLWDEEIKALSPPCLRLSTLERLGGAEQIVRTHLDKTMGALPIEEQDVAARIFRYLVSPSGTKIAHTAADLSEYTQVALSRLEPILEKLSRTGIRILRPVAAPLDKPGLPRYEIFHDVLTGAIADWRTRYVRAQELAEAERLRAESERRLMEERAEADRKLAEARRRANVLILGVIGLSLMLIIMIGLAVFAFQQRSLARHAQLEAVSQRAAAEKGRAEAVKQRNIAERARAVIEDQRQTAVARELSAAALNNLEVNPERSLLLSLYAVKGSISEGKPVLREAEEALHRAVQTSRLQLSLDAESGPEASSCVRVAFSPDGSRLATASRGHLNTVTVWNAVTGKKMISLPRQACQFSGIAFSPDGKRLATSSDDNTVRVWDTVTGKELLTLSGHSNSVNSVVFSPDGKRLATSSDDSKARVWDAVTGKKLFTLSGHSNSVNCLAFCPNGRWLATTGYDKTIRVWDTVTGKEVLILSGNTARINDLDFSPCGKSIRDGSSGAQDDSKDGLSTLILYVPSMRLATAMDDGNTVIWDALSGRELMTLYHSEVSNNAIAFDSTGTRLAAGYDDGVTRVFDVATGRVLLTLPCDTSSVKDLAFSPDGTRLVTAGEDGKARVWDVSPAGGAEWVTLVHPGVSVLDISYSHDGKFLATVDDDGNVRVWDASSGKVLLTLSGHTGRIFSITFSPEGNRLASLGTDQATKVWDAATGNALIDLPIEGQFSVKVNHTSAFSKNGKRLAVCSGATVQIWDASSGKELVSFTNQAGTIFSVAFSPDGTCVATGSDAGIQLWNAITGKEVNNLTGKEGTTYSVAFSTDGKLVAAGRMDKKVKVWNVTTGQMLSTISGHKGIVFSVAFSPDDKHLATASADATVKLWDVSNLEEVSMNPITLSGHAGAIYKVVFSPDGQRLATASQDGTSRVYALAIEDLVAIAKSRVTRTLTEVECKKFLHSEKCPPAP